MRPRFDQTGKPLRDFPSVSSVCCAVARSKRKSCVASPPPDVSLRKTKNLPEGSYDAMLLMLMPNDPPPLTPMPSGNEVRAVGAPPGDRTSCSCATLPEVV